MDYYCTTKFTDLTVHVQSRLLYNCCKAYPERVDLDWLKANPGKLFYTETMLEDRRLMLDNKSCVSCHYGCYKYEEQGLRSARQAQGGTRKTAHEKISDPGHPLTSLSISLSTDCNLSCVYCSPEWSSSWHNEIQKKGDYVLDGESIKTDNFSTLWAKLKQKSRGVESKFFKLLMKEIKLARGIKEISLLGGEPLLNNQLDQLFDAITDQSVSIVTGLGVNDQRIKKILEMIKDKNIQFTISAESSGRFFEFIRHGLKWKDFENRVDMIAQKGHGIKFTSTMSNLSMFDFHNFHRQYYGKHKINLNPITERPFLLPHVLDDKSKQQCIENLSPLSNQQPGLLKLIHKEPSEVDRKNIGNYLKQLSARRQMSLDFLPENFLSWCGLKK